MNKKGFLDTDVLASPGFVILAVMAIGATILGFIMGKRMGYDALPVWQLIMIIIGEAFAAYVFAARG